MAELSLYPLRDEFLPPIDRLLAALNAVPELEVRTSRMSTIVFGEQTLLLSTLDVLLRELREEFGPLSLVCKLLPGAERSINGYEL